MSVLSANVRELVSENFLKLSLDIAGHYLLIDIGANLTNRKFAKDLDAVLQRARDVGMDSFDSGYFIQFTVYIYLLCSRCL